MVIYEKDGGISEIYDCWSVPNRVYKIANNTPPEHTKEPGMNYSTAVMLINPSIRAVRGQYEEQGNTEIFKTLDPELKVDDFAVVQSGTRWGITTVKITEVESNVDFDSTKEVRWVVGKINMDDHKSLLKMEADAIDVIKKGEMRKRREDIKKNTLDAIAAGEINNLEIVKLGDASLGKAQN